MDLKNSRKVLTKEYTQTYKLLCTYFKIGSFNRVGVKNDKFEKKSVPNKLYALLPLAVVFALLYHILDNQALRSGSLMSTEIIINFTCTFFFVFDLTNITYFNKRGNDLLALCIEVDCRIGLQESAFLRKQEFLLVSLLATTAFLVMAGFGITITWIYDFPYELYFTAGAFSFCLSFIYVDIACCLVLFMFMTMRLTYFNVTLVKLTNMDREYLVDHYSNPLWRKQFGDKVDFHKRATPKEILELLHGIIDLKKLSDDCLSCMLFLGTITLIVANFTAVQNFVLYMQLKNLENSKNILRICLVSVWSSSNWFLGLVLVRVADMVHIQSQQTRLICGYNILKTSLNKVHLDLCESVLSTLEMHDLRTSVYKAYKVNTGFLLRVAASVSVYMTMQLQMAFGF